MVDTDTFRTVMGQFATGVTVVTLPVEPPHGITVNAFSSVSLDPPLVLVCIDHETRAYELLAGENGEGVDGYCVNVLTADQRDLGEHFADIVDLDRDPFEADPTRTEVSGAPVFEESLAYADCTVEAAHEAGDHTIYLGRVGSAAVLDADAEPVSFYEGEWGTIAGD
ncbi:flavin reductase [Halobacteriales archaeon SW_12_71_31]|nr:MAG: flavin reductase [Halobacteriales archaeon SW_12_71_31]